MTSYTVLLDLASTDPEQFDLTPFADYHAVLASSPSGHVELVCTVEAGNMRQAVSTVLADAYDRLRFEPFAARVLSTAAFDGGHDLNDTTQTISVAEAAAALGVTPSAVRQRLTSGSIAGQRVGRDWRVNSRLANLYDGDHHVARLLVPAGEHAIVHDGVRYEANGGGHSVGAEPTAYTYLATGPAA
jgi:excisionase family DNA binding protein